MRYWKHEIEFLIFRTFLLHGKEPKKATGATPNSKSVVFSTSLFVVA